MGFRPDEVYCQGCNRLVPINKFRKHQNKYHLNGTQYYCNDCTKRISKEIMAQHCNQSSKQDVIGYELAIRHICSFFDMPFIPKVCTELREEEFSGTRDRNWDYVFQYCKKLKELGYDEEKYWNDLSGNSFLALSLITDRDTKPNSSGDAKLFMELEKEWGKLKSLNEYLYCIESFKEYAEGETLTPFVEKMIRRLVLAELDLTNAREANADSAELKRIEDRIANYGSKLNIDKFTSSQSKSEVEKMLENWAYNFENIEPLDWEDENLKDRLGIDKDYDDIMRSLGNKVVGNKEYPKLDKLDIKPKKRSKKK